MKLTICIFLATSGFWILVYCQLRLRAIENEHMEWWRYENKPSLVKATMRLAKSFKDMGNAMSNLSNKN